MVGTTFSPLFGHAASAVSIKSFLEETRKKAGVEPSEPEVKSYSDSVYINYYTLGLSFMFLPAKTTKVSSSSPLDLDTLSLDSIDVFNPEKNAVLPKGKAYSRYPLLPLAMSLPDADSSGPSSVLELKADTTGQEIVRALGEPSRKGGGAGPSSGSIGIWCEWTKLGVMVEFGGADARGPQAWERGKDAIWKVVTLFKPKDV